MNVFLHVLLQAVIRHLHVLLTHVNFALHHLLVHLACVQHDAAGTPHNMVVFKKSQLTGLKPAQTALALLSVVKAQQLEQCHIGWQQMQSCQHSELSQTLTLGHIAHSHLVPSSQAV